MSIIKVAVEHGGQQYAARIATVHATKLGIADYGHPVLEMTMNLGSNTFVGVGGYSVGQNGPAGRHVGTAFGMDQILAILHTCGSETWEQLPGTRLLVIFDGKDRAIGIAGLDNDQVLIFSEHADSFKGKA